MVLEFGVCHRVRKEQNKNNYIQSITSLIRYTYIENENAVFYRLLHTLKGKKIGNQLIIPFV